MLTQWGASAHANTGSVVGDARDVADPRVVGADRLDVVRRQHGAQHGHALPQREPGAARRGALTTPSISAKPAPMQRRAPPPKGIHVFGAGLRPTNRPGSNWSWCEWFSSRWWASRIDGAPVVPAGRSRPPIVAGAMRVRTTMGRTGCS